MIKRCLLALSLCLSVSCIAQVQQTEKPFIEVNGYAEREVVPDEIYITITLTERYDGHTKITIEEQEQQLKDIVKKQGIDLSSLSLSSADASYVRINWLNKDVIAKKVYNLKVSSADMTSRIFHDLEDINIKNAVVSKVDYYGKDVLKKELRIAAVKNAKIQAEYMLEAIGQTAGKPLYINENSNNYMPYMNMAMSKRANVDNAQTDNTSADNGDYIEFKKIKFSSTVNAKFEIK
ncbi:MAG: SIMPL domain-containing protein [Taibaiella sp.]|nr:SIMPL domain-containing protein [Taibaiella sp.]